MKKKSFKDEFDTKSWCYSIVADPYQVMAEAFSTAGIPHLRSFIKKILHYSEAQVVFANWLYSGHCSTWCIHTGG